MSSDVGRPTLLSAVLSGEESSEKMKRQYIKYKNTLFINKVSKIITNSINTVVNAIPVFVFFILTRKQIAMMRHPV